MQLGFTIEPDLIITGIGILTNLILGFLVFFQDTKNKTGRLLFLFVLSTSLWSLVNYFSYKVADPTLVLILIRSVMMFAVLQALFFFLSMLAFPKNEYHFSSIIKFGVIPFSVIVAIITMTKYVFSEVNIVPGGVSSPLSGPALPLFGITAILLVFSGVFVLVKKFLHSNKKERNQYKYLIFGTALMFISIIVFNFIFPSVLNNTSLIPYSTLFVIPFVGLTAYSIIKFNLFNIKVITTSLIVFALWIFVLLKMLLSVSFQDTIVGAGLFIVLIPVGLSLIRSVRKEVDQKEKLEQLTTKLETANEKLKKLDKMKTEFLSLASHQLRSPITAIKGYTSMLLDGSYGEISVDQRETVSRVFQSSLNLANVVEDLLDVAKIEQGGLVYQFSKINIEKISSALFTEFSLTAKSKGLELTYDKDDAENCFIEADPVKIRQVFLNLIDNSVKYTEKGFVKIAIKKEGNNVIFSVTDSGMGMSPETKEKLFGKFNRGEGTKVNAGGSGLGLYLVKQIVEAHKAKVSADSPGLGKGSTFTVTIPLV